MSGESIDFYNAAVDAAQEGNLPEALKAVENALTEDAQDAQTWQLYAVILRALGHEEKADKAMVKVRELGLSDVDELLMKAADAAGSGQIGAAITHYEDALEIEQERGEIYVSYALVLVEKKYYDDALEAAQKAIELDSEDARAWYARGRVQRLMGQNDEALEALTKSVELDDRFLLARYEQGMMFQAMGNLKEALACFEKVLEEQPADASAAEAKAIILEQIEKQS